MCGMSTFSMLSEPSALEKLKIKREKQKLTACQSHVENDIYMDYFRSKLRISNSEAHDNTEQTQDRATTPARDSRTSKPSSHAVASAADEIPAIANKVHGADATGYRSSLPKTVADGWISGPINETGSPSPREYAWLQLIYLSFPFQCRPSHVNV